VSYCLCVKKYAAVYRREIRQAKQSSRYFMRGKILKPLILLSLFSINKSLEVFMGRDYMFGTHWA
jgi:hypothetical protein